MYIIVNFFPYYIFFLYLSIFNILIVIIVIVTIYYIFICIKSIIHCYLLLIIIKAVIDANIIPKLIELLQNGEFKIKKEAAWAISNATLSGIQEPNQIRYEIL